MKRIMAIVMTAALAASGCTAKFEPTGVTFQNRGTPIDTTRNDDSGGPALDTTPDVPEGPKTCEDLWVCILDNGCALAPAIDDSVCLKKCVGSQDDEQVQKLEELKECAANACATEPNGEALTQCAYQFCTDKWLGCVAGGDGDKTCGDMHHCLYTKCGPDYSSYECVSDCLRDGDKTADQLLALSTACTNSVFFVSDPLICTDGMAACYAGSNGGSRPCGDVLMCEIGCYEDHCPDPSMCNNFGELMVCMYGCLWGLAEEDRDRMGALQQCIVQLSHDKLLKDDYNIYSYCALQAHECFGKQDEFASCEDAVQCMKDTYNYFPGITMGEPQPFWIVASECLVDVMHSHKEPLTQAILCLAEKYAGGPMDIVAPWADCKSFCPAD